MARILIRDAAKRDLLERWVWYAEHAAVETADRFLEAAQRTFSLLSAQPEAGTRYLTDRPELHGLRRFPLSGGFEKTLVFYLPAENGIDVLRVLHGSQDLQNLLSAAL